MSQFGGFEHSGEITDQPDEQVEQNREAQRAELRSLLDEAMSEYDEDPERFMEIWGQIDLKGQLEELKRRKEEKPYRTDQVGNA